MHQEDWDGGYTMAGMIGHGDAFVLRDPSKLGPAFIMKMRKLWWLRLNDLLYKQLLMYLYQKFKKLETMGKAIIIKKDASIYLKKIREPLKNSLFLRTDLFSRR